MNTATETVKQTLILFQVINRCHCSETAKIGITSSALTTTQITWTYKKLKILWSLDMTLNYGMFIVDNTGILGC